MKYQLTWLADVLRAAGLIVVELDGWESAGRGEMGTVKGVLLHHTAGPLKGDKPSLRLVVEGRPDLPGPLSQLFLSRNGTWYCVGAGRCNHAGTGLWRGVAAGNMSFIGIEAENAGTGADPWPNEQMVAYEKGVAAILSHIGADVSMAAGHKEYAMPRGRKIDPSFDMVGFRENVDQLMRDRPRAVPVPAVDPKRSMLRKGDRGESVKLLQTCLMMTVIDSDFGPATEKAVIAFQKSAGLKGDGIVGPATWAALGVA